ncbi:MAG: histidine kinase [Streptosporangiaceae bacterium]
MDDPESRLWAPRIALLVTLAVLGGYALTTLMNVVGQDPGPLTLAALFPCLALVLALQLAHSTRQPRTWPVPVRVLTLSAQTLATYLPLAWIGLPWGAMAGFLAGSLLLSVPGRSRWLLYLGAAAAIVPVVLTQHDGGPGAAIYGIGVTLLTGFIVYGVSSLSALVTEIQETRLALARMAVTAERLRVARDLHDLLGYSLSAIMLKSELAYRLLPTAPQRARSEFTEVLDIARQALADVRMVATGYRDMSLRAESDSALSVLASAKISVRAHLACGPLPREVDTVFSIVLREAVTNVLRHSKAQHCVIRAARAGGEVRLVIANDGVEPSGARAPHSGSGLGNLGTRLGSVGGTLSSEEAENGWYHVVARSPVDERAGDPDSPAEEDDAQEQQTWAPRQTKVIMMIVLVGYLLLTLINAGSVVTSGPGMLGVLGCLTVVFALQLLHSLRRPRTWPVRLRVLSLTVQGAATYAPLLWVDRPWGAMAGFFAGSLLLSGTASLRWGLFAGAVAALVPVAIIESESAYLAYLLTSSLVAGLVVYGITAMYALVVEVHATRNELARLAVTRERLLVARELHEALGSSLSTVTLKSELIRRLLPDAPGRAHDEVAEVLDVSRKALADVRSVASGYRGQFRQNTNLTKGSDPDEDQE